MLAQSSTSRGLRNEIQREADGDPHDRLRGYRRGRVRARLPSGRDVLDDDHVPVLHPRDQGERSDGRAGADEEVLQRVGAAIAAGQLARQRNQQQQRERRQ